MSDDKLPFPRVFISYSWTSEEHSDWVAELGTRLMSDAIDVVLDQWSLEEGQDIHVFMEKMVTDATINRVIIISDAMYSEKADGRKAGVGTETQIISKEVYDSVDQNKFIPIVRERDDTGKACLPVYLKTRKYIDFSDPNTEADAYDQLIRNIFERPKRQKPPLGKPPSHLFDDSPVNVTSAQKATRFRDIVATGKGNPFVAFNDFADEFIVNLEELRMKFSNDKRDVWCDNIKQNIASAHSHRNVFVDVIRSAIHLPSDAIMPVLLNLLERIVPLTRRPGVIGSFSEVSEDNYKFLCYELFLYTFATLIKSKRYSDARDLIDYRFIAPSTYGGSDSESYGVTDFNQYATSLEKICGQRGDTRRLSVMADMLHDRADRKDIRFSDLLQADIILCLAHNGWGWFPRSMVYARDVGKIELFVRATTIDGFRPLTILLNLKSPRELLALIDSESMVKVWRSETFWHGDLTLDAMNLEELQRVWGST